MQDLTHAIDSNRLVYQARLGTGAKHRPNSQVVRAGTRCEHPRDRIVGRITDQKTFVRVHADGFDRYIVWTEVYTISAGREGDIKAIIDDQERSVAARMFAQL